MLISKLSHRLSRLHRIRRRIEYERARSGAGSIRLLRLQALLLRAQGQLRSLTAERRPAIAAIPMRVGLPSPSNIPTMS